MLLTAYSAIPLADTIRGYCEELGIQTLHLTDVRMSRKDAHHFFMTDNEKCDFYCSDSVDDFVVALYDNVVQKVIDREVAQLRILETRF